MELFGRIRRGPPGRVGLWGAASPGFRPPDADFTLGYCRSPLRGDGREGARSSLCNKKRDALAPPASLTLLEDLRRPAVASDLRNGIVSSAAGEGSEQFRDSFP